MKRYGGCRQCLASTQDWLQLTPVQASARQGRESGPCRFWCPSAMIPAVGSPARGSARPIVAQFPERLRQRTPERKHSDLIHLENCAMSSQKSPHPVPLRRAPALG